MTVSVWYVWGVCECECEFEFEWMDWNQVELVDHDMPFFVRIYFSTL